MDKTQDRFSIAQADTLQGLHKLINEAIKDGFEPIGSMFMTAIESKVQMKLIPLFCWGLLKKLP